MIRGWLVAGILVLVLSSIGFAKLGNIIFDDKIESLKKAGMPPAVFPHAKHEDIYKCEDCHPNIFKDKRGANDVTMHKNMNGEFCGAAECHNSPKAFPLYMCNKCHIK